MIARMGWIGLLGGALVLFGHGVAEAQVFTPTFMSPYSSSDIGVYLNDGPGDFSVEGIWRRSGGSLDLGLRAGIADIGDASLLLGAELRDQLRLGAPIDFALTGGAQGVIGDFSALGFVGGVSIGKAISADEFVFTPYIHPRVGLIDGFGDDDGFDLDLLADIGLDARISDRLDLRFGVSIESEGSDWGVGFAWR